jgi:DNA mismatch repair ATPase MutS
MDRDPCKEVIKNLHRILEQDPTDNLCEKIKAHLKQCTSCAKRYEELEALISLCNRFPAEQIPDEKKRLMKDQLKKALIKH